MMRRHLLLAAAIACVVAIPRASAQMPDVQPIALGSVAEKLGVKVMINTPRELELGRSATATLAEPKKLEPFIKNMHEGARVTITCVGPNAVRVEADELEPIEQKAAVVLKVGPDGALTPAPAKPNASKP